MDMRVKKDPNWKRILVLLQNSTRPMKAMEIEKELGIPSGSVSSLLTQLSKVEAIDRDGETPLGYTFR